jgi:hypothetical protein
VHGDESCAGFLAFASNSSTVGFVFSVETKAISPVQGLKYWLIVLSFRNLISKNKTKNSNPEMSKSK